jgi:hypothetical protein
MAIVVNDDRAAEIVEILDRQARPTKPANISPTQWAEAIAEYETRRAAAIVSILTADFVTDDTP